MERQWLKEKELQKKLKDAKKEVSTWQGILEDLHEIIKIDNNILINENISSNTEENQHNLWIPSIEWKMINMKQILPEEKLLAICEHAKDNFQNDLL